MASTATIPRSNFNVWLAGHRAMIVRSLPLSSPDNGSAAVASVFVLRARQGDAVLPFRAWGYPWAPLAFVTMGVVVVGNELWRNR